MSKNIYGDNITMVVAEELNDEATALTGRRRMGYGYWQHIDGNWYKVITSLGPMDFPAYKWKWRNELNAT